MIVTRLALPGFDPQCIIADFLDRDTSKIDALAATIDEFVTGKHGFESRKG